MSVYTIFDGDEDKWAYGYLKGWHENKSIDFGFSDSHDLDNMTARAQNEQYVKTNLRTRLEKSTAVLVLVGEKTKNLYKYIRWELELALELGLPIIVCNLNNSKALDSERCPAIIRDECVVNIPFKLAAIKHALKNWPAEFSRFNLETKQAGARHYSDQIYASLGI